MLPGPYMSACPLSQNHRLSELSGDFWGEFRQNIQDTHSFGRSSVNFKPEALKTSCTWWLAVRSLLNQDLVHAGLWCRRCTVFLSVSSASFCYFWVLTRHSNIEPMPDYGTHQRSGEMLANGVTAMSARKYDVERCTTALGSATDTKRAESA